MLGSLCPFRTYFTIMSYFTTFSHQNRFIEGQIKQSLVRIRSSKYKEIIMIHSWYFRTKATFISMGLTILKKRRPLSLTAKTNICQFFILEKCSRVNYYCKLYMMEETITASSRRWAIIFIFAAYSLTSAFQVRFFRFYNTKFSRL